MLVTFHFISQLWSTFVSTQPKHQSHSTPQLDSDSHYLSFLNFNRFFTSAVFFFASPQFITGIEKLKDNGWKSSSTHEDSWTLLMLTQMMGMEHRRQQMNIIWYNLAHLKDEINLKTLSKLPTVQRAHQIRQHPITSQISPNDLSALCGILRFSTPHNFACKSSILHSFEMFPFFIKWRELKKKSKIEFSSKKFVTKNNAILANFKTSTVSCRNVCTFFLSWRGENGRKYFHFHSLARPDYLIHFLISHTSPC